MEINKPIATIFLLIIDLIIIFLFVIPKYQESDQMQINLAKRQGEYENLSDYQIKLSDILKDIENREDILKKIDAALPVSFSSSNATYFLQEKASENQLMIKLLAFSEPVPTIFKKEIKSVAMALNLSGSYQGFKNFLSSLEKSDKLFRIDSISFAALTLSPEKNYPQGQLDNYDFKLDVRAYIYP